MLMSDFSSGIKVFRILVRYAPIQFLSQISDAETTIQIYVDIFICCNMLTNDISETYGIYIMVQIS